MMSQSMAHRVKGTILTVEVNGSKTYYVTAASMSSLSYNLKSSTGYRFRLFDMI